MLGHRIIIRLLLLIPDYVNLSSYLFGIPYAKWLPYDAVSTSVHHCRIILQSLCLSPFFWSLRCFVFFFSKLYYQLFSIFAIIFLFSLASYILFCTASQFCFLAVLISCSSCVFSNVFAGWISQSLSSKCQWWEIAMISHAASMSTEHIGRHEKYFWMWHRHECDFFFVLIFGSSVTPNQRFSLLGFRR